MGELALLGAVQGIAEWLPVSSEGVLLLLQSILGNGGGTEQMLRVAFFLHLGTFTAALVYLRNDVLSILRTLVRYRESSGESKALLRFLAVSSLVSFALGAILFSGIASLPVSGMWLTFGVGMLLLFTAGILFFSQKRGVRKTEKLNFADALVAGLAQGFSVLPGISRSGFTVSSLLLRQIDDAEALRLSFLMSLPAVLGANLFVNFSTSFFSLEYLVALLFSFVFGLATIHLLLRLARRLNFAVFVLVFGLFVIASVFV